MKSNPSSNEIRQAFLDYFASKGHQVVSSSSLVPHGDPTLLFTNAGMNQFKDVFLGFDKRPYTRAASSQKCVRAGGKHNDLENVGYTARHHTFFEMLGNFSFGDYFKQDAIHYAWELLTEVFKLPKDKLTVSVYAEDNEAYDIWTKQIGVPAERVIQIGDNKGARYASDNFWMMGDTGPCGPCTEIFYDHGAHIPGGPPGSPDEDGDRFIEIWNNVFMQFNRDDAGVMHPLPKPSVDTGMGLERIAAVLQGVHSNYEIDLFRNLITAAHRVISKAGGATEIMRDLMLNKVNPSFKVLADHIRACSFLIADGVIPGNEGRGYVLRRIIRRAIRHGYKLGARKAFFYKMVPDLVAEMGEAYPELKANGKRVMEVLRQEEKRFFETIEHGMAILERALLELQVAGLGRSLGIVDLNPSPVEVPNFYHWIGSHGQIGRYDIFVGRRMGAVHAFVKMSEHEQNQRKVLYVIAPADEQANIENELNRVRDGLPNQPTNLLILFLSEDELSQAGIGSILNGETAFKLHDTYGFPVDLTANVCRERGVTVDEARFNELLEEQRRGGREGGKFKMAANLEYDGQPTTFHGYEKLETSGKVLALYKDGAAVNSLSEGDLGVVVLDNTPFYAESGGQVGDRGVLQGTDGIFAVEDTQKIQASVFGHHGILKTGGLSIGNTVTAKVDLQARARTMRNHSATHLMHKALREVLGSHVQQKGSLVDAEKTRFDFAHNAPMTDEEIRKVENIVNAEILANTACQARVMGIEDAQKTGAMMLFGEKYGDEVRVLDIGSSRELCGGTHVQRTGDIGLFSIVAEGGVAAGVRRVEAVTGQNALAYMQAMETALGGVAGTLKVLPTDAPVRVGALLDQVRRLERELAALKGKLASEKGDDLVSQAVDIGGIKVLTAVLEGADATGLRETVDKLKDKLKSAAIVLAAISDGKVSLAAGVTADLTAKLKAGELVNLVAQQVGGKGGGRPDMAMAGGTDPSKLPQALGSVADWVQEKLH